MSATSALNPAGGRTGLGATLVLLAGVGLIGYGVMFLVRNFTGFIELGLTPAHVGGTPEEIRAFSGHLYNYISHLQVAVGPETLKLGEGIVGAQQAHDHRRLVALRHAGRFSERGHPDSHGAQLPVP